MRSAAKHPNEAERQAALERLDLLDSLQEADFDDLTLLASQICETPTALVSLIDKSRQWFKSKQGITATETPRDVAFCAHAILQNDLFIVPDASKDERFHDNPLVTGETKLKYYAGAPLYSPDGFPVGTLCVIDSKPRELSERQLKGLKAIANQVMRLLTLRAEHAELEKTRKQLENNESYLNRIINAVPMMIGHWSRDLINLNCNAAYSKNFTMPLDKIKGASMKELLGESLFQKNLPYIEAVLKGEPQSFEREVTVSSGETRYTIIQYIPDLDGKTVNGFFVIVSDITELKTMEREREAIIANMVESSKLATLGDMAGGVAHEFNTPLAIIISKTESLLRKARQGELEREVVISQLEKIKETSERIAKIVKGLRQFSRISDDDSTHHVSVEATIEATLNLCREKILSTGISLSTQLTPNLEFLGRQSEVAQVLMNLLLNAADAVENGKDRRIEIESNVSDNFVQIAVSDYGHGIPKPILDKIMNPFFSTKEIGKGTGLGLSIAKGIAEAHGGKLVCESRINPTRFVLELPLAPTNSKKSVA